MASHHDFFTQCDPTTSLADISWDAFTPGLQETCWQFIREWQTNWGIEELREMSGLNDMTLAEFLAYQEKQKERICPGKRYRLVAYLRINPEEEEDEEPMTREQALAEQEQQELMCPENLYRIEAISNHKEEGEYV